MSDTTLPNFWEVVSIGSLCQSVESTSPAKRGVGSFRYIDISSIDNHTKQITDIQEIDNSNAPSRARQIVATNDVIVSTVRPTLNAVALIPEELNGEICSTGFCVLRTDKELLNPEYLFAWVRHPQFIQSLIRLERGIGYPAVSDSDVRSVKVPLPPLPEQARIVAILRQADELRRLRQQAFTIKEQILPSLYHEMFSESQNGKLEKIAVEDILESEDGIRTGPFGTQLKVHELVEIGSPVYGIENVYPNQFVPEVSKFITDEKFKQLGRYAVKPEDILLTRMGTVGRACVLPDSIPDKAIISYHLFRLRSIKKRCLPDFLAATLNYSPYVAYQLQNFAYGAVMSGLNADTVRSIKMALPPIEIQERFVRIVENMLSETGHFSNSDMRINALFQALLSQAFSGELTAVYRDQHQAELQEAAVQRDIALGLRGQEPRMIDFRLGRVTPEEEEQFRQAFQRAFRPAFQELLASFNTVDVGASLARQINFPNFAELLRPALPEYESVVTRMLADNVALVSEMMHTALPHITKVITKSITPLAESIQLSNEAFYQSLGQHMLALADAHIQQAAQQEPPQPDRAIHAQMDTFTKALLQAVQALPIYFTPSELHGLLQEYGHYFDQSQDNDLVQIEAALHLLQTLGFVRRIMLDGRLVYRLVDPIQDGALPPKELDE